jgi:hypothetical protein
VVLALIIGFLPDLSPREKQVIEGATAALCAIAVAVALIVWLTRL